MITNKTIIDSVARKAKVSTSKEELEYLKFELIEISYEINQEYQCCYESPVDDEDYNRCHKGMRYIDDRIDTIIDKEVFEHMNHIY
jgi:hypothetical protein